MRTFWLFATLSLTALVLTSCSYKRALTPTPIPTSMPVPQENSSNIIESQQQEYTGTQSSVLPVQDSTWMTSSDSGKQTPSQITPQKNAPPTTPTPKIPKKITPAPKKSPTTVPTTTKTVTQIAVSINNFSFSPASITIKKGTEVSWKNNDPVGHTVTFDNFGSSILQTDDSYSFIFNEIWTYEYKCIPHPNMRGTVTVTE